MHKKNREKLDFIKKTFDLHNEGKFFIPTFYPEVDSQREFLNIFENGIFNFIKILDIYDLIDIMERKKLVKY